MIRCIPDFAGVYFTVDGRAIDYVYAFGKCEAATRVARLLEVDPGCVRVVRNYKELKGK